MRRHSYRRRKVHRPKHSACVKLWVKRALTIIETRERRRKLVEKAKQLFPDYA